MLQQHPQLKKFWIFSTQQSRPVSDKKQTNSLCYGLKG